MAKVPVIGNKNNRQAKCINTFLPDGQFLKYKIVKRAQLPSSVLGALSQISDLADSAHTRFAQERKATTQRDWLQTTVVLFCSVLLKSVARPLICCQSLFQTIYDFLQTFLADSHDG
ncbi:MAG: hypothetical protein IJ694_08675 [Acidaminococcaceae bacterium]|nr:hypothetical protein [Acidaminococcaceae bacterium]